MKKDEAKIVVVGSSNMDLVVKSPRIPAVGETIIGGDFLMTPGGKGANQAVAAARLGADVHLIARLGDDIFAEKSLDNFKNAGIDTEFVTRTSDAPSGVALIMVDQRGENIIVVASGANGKLSPEDVQAAESVIASADVLVMQLEVPMQTVEFAASLAHQRRVPVILDPAPARELNRALLKNVDVLTPNETEAEILTGIKVEDGVSAQRACERLLETGVGAVILTMGRQGFLLMDGQSTRFSDGIGVEVIDTTAAGDAFTGALATRMGEGESLWCAAEFANHVAAYSATKMGAQISMPGRKEIESFIYRLM